MSRPCAIASTVCSYQTKCSRRVSLWGTAKRRYKRIRRSFRSCTAFRRCSRILWLCSPTGRARPIVNVTIAISVTGRTTGIADLLQPGLPFREDVSAAPTVNIRPAANRPDRATPPIWKSGSFTRNNRYALLMHTEIENGVSPAAPHLPQKGTAS